MKRSFEWIPPTGDRYCGAIAYFEGPVFADQEMLVPHPRPVIADSRGRFPRVFVPVGTVLEKVERTA